ncbi:MAG: hypothetical protein HYZ88_00160 [Candidatus Omnitrophica bacterium]|nr:hypothetical protein [Candidatus Omnitrophota bacterium]
MRQTAGVSYLEIMFAITVVLVMVTSVFMGLTNGIRLMRAMQVRTALLNVGQSEMERVRGIPFTQLDSYTISRPQVLGEVTVDQLTARRKRVTVFLRHLRETNQSLILVTDVHQHGLNP